MTTVETAVTTSSPETKICRTIRLSLIEESKYGGDGRPVTKSAPPSERISGEEFLKTVLPGKKVEHLGRRQIMKVSWRQQPTSLFFQAVHACFRDHHALTLRPEALMHLIVNEVATTVQLHPEEYRHLFTKASDKQRIDVRHDGLKPGNPDSPWQEAIGLFGPKLRELVPPGIMEHLLPALSTATPESETAALVAFMAAASPFYDYHTHTLCGIPEIRLAGDPEDYKKMLAAASQLSEVFRAHLGKYFDHLLPVLTTLAEQAAGAPQDELFWSSLYKFQSRSGSDVFNGWITAFVNYVLVPEIKESQYQKAQKGGLVQKRDDLFDWKNRSEESWLKGLVLGSVPSHVCVAPFTWHYFGEEKKMLFAGGMLGIEDHEGSVMPILSYAVLNDG